MPSAPVPGADAFHAFEHAGWQSATHGYNDAFGSLTRQAIGPLLHAAGAAIGVRVLDVASGPGYAAAAAAALGARVTAVDFSSEMVALARSLHPGIDFREDDATALALPDATFDAVMMNFGMLHLARPESAVAEAFRVLRPGGRYAFSVWAPPEEAVGFGIILDAVRDYGDAGVPLPPGPPFFRFSEPAECERVLRDAGFADTSVEKCAMTWSFATAGDLFEAFYGGTVRTRALLLAQTPTKLEAVRTGVGRAASRFATNRGLQIPMPAVIAAAARPGK